MSTTSENRDIELLFEEEMPGYRCIVTRQAEGAINLQFESLASHKTITFPAPAPELWDSPEKLKEMCEQITGEFLLLCDEQPPTSEGVATRITKDLAEKLAATFQAMGNRKESR
ncbi:hypothetical protein E8F11_11430 [Pseudomonas sp. BN417]|uniref:hypothetical protein n=1 Tax=Pseudomonas sp. BN417 TaxID=2567890 RepID=UPI002455E7AF|nr:hypothetical protein [Pseudomonas sp. BN417]MDH4555774.1 hypothetical protein [Pseudomonas sp. BN417]